MDEVVGGLIALVIGLTAAFFGVWLALAVLMRVLALLVIFWAVTFLLGSIGGLLAGFAVPVRVLRGRAMAQPVVVTPADVVADKVLVTKARGAAKNFGWDRAWPAYVPYQARHDARAVVEETNQIVTKLWPYVSPTRWTKAAPAAGGTGTTAPSKGRVKQAWKLAASLPGIGWMALAAPPLAGFFLGLWLSILLWLAAMSVFGGGVYLVQQIWILAYRWFDRLARRKDRASLKCPHCYRETTTPSYRCPNHPTCTVIHRDVSPGPLGMMHRRCDCGSRLPTTVRAAAKALVAVCPFCGVEVAGGAGTRRTIQLPTVGAVSAGKTRLLAAIITTLESRVTAQGGTVTALTPSAENFAHTASAVVRASLPTEKTPERMNPEGWPFCVELGGKTLELHLIDAAGEAFASMDSTQSLGYIDIAEVILFVVDPLGLPHVLEEAKRPGVNRRLEIAETDQEDAYASVIDRLRAESANLKTRKLGVVLTKLDVLQNLPAGRQINPGSSDDVRQWLIDRGEDGLVRRVEDDFTDVSYFGIDLMQPREVSDPRHPIRVLQWVLDKSDTKMSMAPAALPAPVVEVVS